MSEKKADGKKIRLENVRLSFPSLWKKAVFDGDTTKFEATLLIPKGNTKLIGRLNAMIEQTKGKHKIKAERIALKDGDESEYDGYEGNMSLKASNETRPTVIDKDRTPVIEEDGIVYSGCYVNAIVQPWLQNNAFGKRVNFNLLGVQFVKDGDSFTGGGKAADADDFDDLSDEDDFDDDIDF